MQENWRKDMDNPDPVACRLGLIDGRSSQSIRIMIQQLPQLCKTLQSKNAKHRGNSSRSASPVRIDNHGPHQFKAFQRVLQTTISA